MFKIFVFLEKISIFFQFPGIQLVFPNYIMICLEAFEALQKCCFELFYGNAFLNSNFLSWKVLPLILPFYKVFLGKTYCLSPVFLVENGVGPRQPRSILSPFCGRIPSPLIFALFLNRELICLSGLCFQPPSLPYNERFQPTRYENFERPIYSVLLGSQRVSISFHYVSLAPETLQATLLMHMCVPFQPYDHGAQNFGPPNASMLKLQLNSTLKDDGSAQPVCSLHLVDAPKYLHLLSC